MAQLATLNIRLPETLKQHGYEVLRRSGVSPSDAVRQLFEYLEREQKLPADIFDSADDSSADHRRNLLKSLVGIVPADYSLAEARQDRLAARGM